MAKYSAQLVAKSNENKNVTTTLSNVNPETAPAKIRQFAQTLNALTTNTYNETNYIVTTNLDTETPSDTRQTPTLALSVTPSIAQIPQGLAPTVNYDGDGQIYFYRKSGLQNLIIEFSYNNNLMTFKQTQTPTPGVFVVGAKGTDNYKPIEVEYTME